MERVHSKQSITSSHGLFPNVVQLTDSPLNFVATSHVGTSHNSKVASNNNVHRLDKDCLIWMCEELLMTQLQLGGELVH